MILPVNTYQPKAHRDEFHGIESLILVFKFVVDPEMTETVSFLIVCWNCQLGVKLQQGSQNTEKTSSLPDSLDCSKE